MQCEHREAIHEIQHMQYKYKLQYIKTTYILESYRWNE